ncbi:MAG: NADP-dependent oxidoreductase [Acidimicrobiales bacterium]|nr:NADP-dependent oxidoreductase [Acidimicrobiales bacterium]
MTDVNRQLVLARRPIGAVQDDDFELRTGPVPEPGPGQFLVRVLWLSFDPTQRGWLNDVPSYVPPVQIGEVMRAGAVGQVVASHNPGFAVGDYVQGTFGWQDYVATDGTGMLPVTKVPPGVPPTAVLGVFGITGLTAYFGMLELGHPKEGDVVLVSGAAGATGSVAGQIARVKGCRVIGTAGGPEKCAWVRDVAGFDECIDYKADDVGRRLAELAPRGIDVYFDNVGGPVLEAALANLGLRARVVLCGGISSGYTMEELPPGPRNYMQLVIRRARMEGFLVLDYAPRFAEAVAQLAAWVADGSIRTAEDVQVGLERAPATLRRLFEGKNLGKQLLKVADPPIAS